MTIHNALHPRDDVDRLYMPRKEGGREFAINEDSVDPSIQRVKDDIKKQGGRLITATRNNTDNMNTNRTTITREKNRKKKIPWAFFCD